MTPELATIEIFHGGRWHPAGTLTPSRPERGYRGESQFEYLTDYAINFTNSDTAMLARLSCRYPVDFDLHQEARWPAFILDILPSGYGRQQWLNHLELDDGPTADWSLLLNGAAFPPGNLRIAEAAASKDLSTLVPLINGEMVPMREHPGFAREDVLARSEHFVEYAYQHAIYAAGGSDVQGVAPKLLLTQSNSGFWHAEGALTDQDVKAHWIVKRARGRTLSDHKILKNEAAYMSVADKLGLRVFSQLCWEQDNLFIPRFDRTVSPIGIERHGMESLCSLAGIAEYGVPVSHDLLCKAIIQYCTNSGRDLLEYIKRDIVNVVMGNKDNHSRNTAVMRYANGNVAMSPLFDFAPMYLDPEGIARVCRWEGETERGGSPEWGKVLELYGHHLDDAKSALRQFGSTIKQLPSVMSSMGVDEDIIENRMPYIEQNARQLIKL
jgi:serine/threonine-protein kinase HipA